MIHRYTRVLMAVLLAGMTTAGYAQTVQSPQDTSGKVPNVLTADSLASGNAKDVLTSFFQLAFDHLTGPVKELNFASNPYAVMVRADSSLLIDTNFSRYRALRKLNFGFGLRLDSSYRFNGFSSGVKYALVNQRDTAASKWLYHALHNDALARQRTALHDTLLSYAIALDTAQGRRRTFVRMIHLLFSVDTPFDKLDTVFQAKVRDIVHADPDKYGIIVNMVDHKAGSNLFREMNVVRFDSLKNIVKAGWLWTVGVSDTTYKDQFFFSNIVLGTELVKGIGAYHRGSNVEFDLLASLQLLDDTLVHGRNLQRGLFTFQPGFNWVIRNAKNDRSWLEFQLSGAYSRNVTTLYAGEKRDSLTFNGTLRLRIINDIWVPLQITYDPRTGNVWGFLNVKVNFSALSGLVNGSKTAAKNN